MAVSVESTVTTLGRFPQGIVDIVPTQVPANFLDCAGVGVDAGCEDAVARFVFDSITCFAFGFVDFSGAGVGLSSEIGAGRRGAVIASVSDAIRHRLISFIFRNALSYPGPDRIVFRGNCRVGPGTAVGVDLGAAVIVAGAAGVSDTRRKVAVPLIPSPDCAVTAAVIPSLFGVNVQATSLNMPVRHEAMLPSHAVE